MTAGYLRRLFTVLLVGGALFVVWIATAVVVGAAGADNDATICINYTTCYDSNTGALVPNPNQNPAPTTYSTPPLVYTPSTVAYVPGQVAYQPSGSGYPPNTVISTYFDPRYGTVSIVTDQWGNLINVNAATGQRIYPYADYGYFGYGFGYTNSFYPGAYYGGYPYYGYGANYCGTGLYAPACPNVPSIQPVSGGVTVVGTRIVPVAVKSAAPPVQVPVADPQLAPAAPAVSQVAPAPQPAPAQMATSLAAAQQPAAPQAPVAVPTSGGANGTTVQGSVTAVVAAPQVAPGNDDHHG
jgi:hypothetical protein